MPTIEIPKVKSDYADRIAEVCAIFDLHSGGLAPVAPYILQHHERWDGRGYSLGLKGEQIHLLSRILTVVDAYDAMTSDRPYRGAMSHEEALEELQRCTGSQFDPQLVEIFVRLLAGERESCTEKNV